MPGGCAGHPPLTAQCMSCLAKHMHAWGPARHTNACVLRSTRCPLLNEARAGRPCCTDAPLITARAPGPFSLSPSPQTGRESGERQESPFDKLVRDNQRPAGWGKRGWREWGLQQLALRGSEPGGEGGWRIDGDVPS